MKFSDFFKKINPAAVSLILIVIFFPEQHFLFIPKIGAQTLTGKYSGHPQTIAHDFLDMEKPFGTTTSSYKRLNDLLSKAKIRFKREKKYSSNDAFSILKSIHEFLKGEGFLFKKNYLLNAGLRSRIIDCDNYSALYTAIAEVTGLPILPVYAPNHSFIRFYFNDGSFINWEVTTGEYKTNAYYKKHLLISNTSVKKNVYLKSLSRKEFLGVQYNTLGNFLYNKKKYNASVLYYNEAIGNYANYSAAYYNRGLSLYSLKKYGDALKDLKMALSLDPTRAGTHNNIAAIYLVQKKYNFSKKHYLISIKLNPLNSAAYYNIGLIMEATGRKKESKKWFLKSKEVESMIRSHSIP